MQDLDIGIESAPNLRRRNRAPSLPGPPSISAKIAAMVICVPSFEGDFSGPRLSLSTSLSIDLSQLKTGAEAQFPAPFTGDC
ncbi:MAG: hypothetical protein QNJ06_05900 [Kiloniellales bacterium]|nr:hypothetical protein [Kiloniellales bacterium]